jgi:hypothetical protein
MRPLPLDARRQFGVFLPRQAYAAGWTRSALRHAVDTGRLTVVRRGVLGITPEPTGDRFADDVAGLRQLAAAVSLTNPRIPVSHAAAAALLDLPLLGVEHPVCVSVPRGFRGHIAGVHLHRTRLWPGSLARLGPVVLTSPARTVVDIGRESGPDASLVAADAALHRRLTTAAALGTALAHCRGWPGVRASAEAVAFADALAESPLESLSRLRMAQFGLPPPLLQRVISTQDGRELGRVDFYWEQFGVVGEADGRLKYDPRRAPDALVREKDRQSGLEDAELITVRWGWSALRDFAPTADRLRRAFARGAQPGRVRRWQASAPPWSRDVAAS